MFRKLKVNSWSDEMCLFCSPHSLASSSASLFVLFRLPTVLLIFSLSFLLSWVIEAFLTSERSGATQWVAGTITPNTCLAHWLPTPASRAALCCQHARRASGAHARAAHQMLPPRLLEVIVANKVIGTKKSLFLCSSYARPAASAACSRVRKAVAMG